MDGYVVRIYRRDPKEPLKLAGWWRVQRREQHSTHEGNSH
jgi:hypothetical protein